MNYFKLLLSKSKTNLVKPKDSVHSLLDDAQGMLTGIIILSIGVVLFKSAGIYSGGTTGLALILYYFTDYPLGIMLILVNLPFYFLAYFRMGIFFTIKSILVVALLSLAVSIVPDFIYIQHINVYFAAIVGGLLLGVGLIQIFRHRGSAGGFNILILYLQDLKGWNAGLVQLLLDFFVILISVFSGSPNVVIASFLGMAVMNLSIGINHRPGRYISY